MGECERGECEGVKCDGVSFLRTHSAPRLRGGRQTCEGGRNVRVGECEGEGSGGWGECEGVEH